MKSMKKVNVLKSSKTRILECQTHASAIENVENEHSAFDEHLLFASPEKIHGNDENQCPKSDHDVTRKSVPNHRVIKNSKNPLSKEKEMISFTKKSRQKPLSTLMDHQRFTSTPEKDAENLNPNNDLTCFSGDVTLFDSPEKLSPISTCPASPGNRNIFEIKLFEDNDQDNGQMRTKKPKHDYSGMSCKKVLFNKEKKVPAAKKTKKPREKVDLEDWASKLSAHFMDIASTELVIE